MKSFIHEDNFDILFIFKSGRTFKNAAIGTINPVIYHHEER